MMEAGLMEKKLMNPIDVVPKQDFFVCFFAFDALKVLLLFTLLMCRLCIFSKQRVNCCPPNPALDLLRLIAVLSAQY